MTAKHYIFDADGTLIDSMPTWIGTHKKTVVGFGGTMPEDFAAIITPLGSKAAIPYILSLGVAATKETYLSTVNGQLQKEYEETILLKPFVKERLLQLKEAGVHLHVLSAGEHCRMDPCLKRNGIYELFECVWSGEDFETHKNVPETFREAARRLGARPEDCVMVDDNLSAITAAHEAGLQTVAVYDAISADKESAMRAVADRYICDFSQL